MTPHVQPARVSTLLPMDHVWHAYCIILIVRQSPEFNPNLGDL